MPAIHGDKGTIRVIEDGAVVNIIEVNEWNASEDANAEKRHYAGQRYPKTRKNVMGWRGRISIDVTNPNLDFLIQRINDAEDQGVNVPSVVIALVEQYDSRDIGAGGVAGTVHIFSDTVLIYDDHSGAGKPDLIRKSFSFEAARKRVENL